MTPKASFYFVLYLIGIVNLLAVITERDYALDNLMRDYEKPLALSAPSSVQWIVARPETLEVLVSNIKTETERSTIIYHVASPDHFGEGEFSTTPIIDPGTGNAKFVGNFRKEGEYRFQVWAEVTRQLPKDAGGQRVRTGSDTTAFSLFVSNKKSEIPGARFSMGVDKRSEQWISGVPYVKTIFVNTDPGKVSLSGLPAGFRRDNVGGNAIRLVWEKPVPGKTELALNGNAGRNLSASLDAATLAFSVNVEPPVWNPLPTKTAYWSIPYTFESKVGELDVNDYSLSVFANGSTPVQTVSTRQFPLIIMPDKAWTSLTFIARSNGGHEMLRTVIPVKMPPPPQIKWTSSRLVGDDYVISFSAEDVGGKDVSVNCALVQPAGLNAVLSARHGKSFTFTIKNVTTARPPALVIRTSIHGIGGVSVPLDRTFPILY